MTERYGKQLDVICMIGGDGTVVPIRIRFIDEDGQRQVHNIKEYKDLSHMGTSVHADGMYVTNETKVFDCKIALFGSLRSIMLYFDVKQCKWTIKAF